MVHNFIPPWVQQPNCSSLRKLLGFWLKGSNIFPPLLFSLLLASFLHLVNISCHNGQVEWCFFSFSHCKAVSYVLVQSLVPTSLKKQEYHKPFNWKKKKKKNFNEIIYLCYFLGTHLWPIFIFAFPVKLIHSNVDSI